MDQDILHLLRVIQGQNTPLDSLLEFKVGYLEDQFFTPIFPDLYDFDLGGNLSIQSPNFDKKGKQDFNLRIQPHCIDIDYNNIKKIHIYEQFGIENYEFFQDEIIQVEIYLEFKRPLKSEPSVFNLCRNGPKDLSYDQKFYLNYWNKNQVVFMLGSSKVERISKFLQDVTQASQYVRIYNNSRKLKGFVPNEQKSLTVIYSDLIRSNLVRETDRILKLLNQLNFQIHHSFFALISANKLRFNNFEKLVSILQILIEEQHALGSPFRQNYYYDLEYISFICDKLVFCSHLNFQYEFSKPQNKSNFDRLSSHENFVRQRQLNVTPTLYHFLPAVFQESNKVVRMNRDNKSLQFFPEPISIIRVNFVSEFLKKDYYSGASNSSKTSHIEQILLHGLTILDCRYQFLSYSNSQLKKHSCWMQAGYDSDLIVQQFGSFIQESNIFKRFARKGQCFTTTKRIEYLKVSDIEYIQDVERNGYNFTDGCGFISQEYAKELWMEYGYPPVSALQIRVKGAKGMLMVSGRQIESKIQLRQSQIKFESNNYSFEVCGQSKWSQGYFNSQTILLLHCLGVPRHYFVQTCNLVKKYSNLRHLRLAIKTFQDPRTLALEFQLYLSSIQSLNTAFSRAIIKDFHDAFLEQVFRVKQLHEIQKLNFKQRFIMPDSAVLYGVPDDLGILQENEIFVQIQRYLPVQGNFELKEVYQELSKKEVLQGRVLVTKSPCTHPGDVRSLECVRVDEYMHLTNVIVFSTRGQRPQFNMMSNGDLDGDKYQVIWNRELLGYIPPENIQPPCESQNLDSFVDTLTGDRPVHEVFTFYLKRDVLGRIANKWKKLCAKKGQDGPKDEFCKVLSHYQQISVDFGKHGKCLKELKILEMENKLNQQVQHDDQTIFDEIIDKNGLDQLYLEFYQQEWHLQNNEVLNSKMVELVLNNEDIYDPLDYVKICHQQIVEPFSDILKDIMKSNHILFESELFQQDLHGVKTPRDYDEEAIVNIRQILKLFVDKFKSIKEQIISDAVMIGDEIRDPNAFNNVSVAIYLATYFKGQDIRLNQHPKFREFSELFVEKDQINSGSSLVNSQHRPPLEKFLKDIKKAENGDLDCINKIIDAKQLLCIPWLLCGEDLLENY